MKKQDSGVRRVGKEIAALCLLALALLFILSLVSYDSGDPTLLTSSGNQQAVHNSVGIVGANLAALLLVAVGISAYWLPLFLVLAAIGLLRKQPWSHPILFTVGSLLLIIGTSGLAALHWPVLRLWHEVLPGSGGMVGLLLKSSLLYYFKPAGAYLLLCFLVAASLLMVTSLSLRRLGQLSLAALQAATSLLRTASKRPRAQRKRPRAPKREPAIVKVEDKPKPVEPPQQEQFNFMAEQGEFRLPSIALLDKIDEEAVTPDHGSLLMNSRILEKKLSDFGVDGKVTEVCPGPVITMYEFEPAPGVKISKIVGLSDDLAMALRAPSIRVVAPIPGKGTLGIEIPNLSRVPVSIREVVVSREFSEAKGKLVIALGKDITGNPVVTNLARMPHLLIAGATGTGKSVCLNAIIVSLLYRATPDDVRLLLIDPKRIELSSYEGIPHLLHPVVTDPKKANIALKWAVGEMERRYELLKLKGVRSIQRYNQLVEREQRRRYKALGRALRDQPDEQEAEILPYLVLIIDELADLMMIASREVEESIIRLAQMARAAGIHLILATQRPSVDVLTGIIKANIPARISFQVSSRTDSRTILDANGAESLLGAGDMLLLPPGTAKLQRIHGAYVSEPEVRRITDFLRKQRKPDYDDSILEYREDYQNGPEEEDRDEKYEEAVQLVLKTRQASISMIQRRLRVGYNRAARMIEMMEREGLVSPPDGSKPREVLPPG
ncbi:MAG: DNA translocase FtsK [Deltaproteobacteria bacterium]|nr:DNA translocase FtsK [Deltaproteobacteria bacterium]MBW2070176.1 DNA translocase FtsK [Deltaproteobacteria bacterium]